MQVWADTATEAEGEVMERKQLVERGWAVKIWPGKTEHFMVCNYPMCPATFETKALAAAWLATKTHLPDECKPRIVPVEIRELPPVRKPRKAVRK